MIKVFRLTLSLAILAIAQPSLAQGAPTDFAHVLDRLRCAAPSGTEAEITICGRSRENERFRVPTELRNTGPIDARNQSPVAARREEGSLDRFGAQTVGPGGYLQRSRQIDCEWRAARQTLQGRQPDCTVHIGPDEASDWQRR